MCIRDSATEAAEAWDACAQASAGSEWANEARARAEAIRTRLRAPRPQSKQQLREDIEDRLLVQWAEAETAGERSRADTILATVERDARTLADGGDTMPIDEVELIRPLRWISEDCMHDGPAIKMCKERLRDVR